jgi:hypothetical protein
MLSLFWVAVCVVAQPTNNAAYAAAILLRKMHFNGLMGLIWLLIARLEMKASEGSPRGDLRILCCSEIHPSLEKWSVQLVLVRETVLPEVVLHVTPPDLRPNVTRELKFQPARQLVAPVSTVH